MNKHPYITITLLIFLCRLGMGQYSISGQVVDNEGVKISQVELFDLTSSREESSDFEGSFVFTDLEKGFHEIVIYSESYNTQHLAINLSSNIDTIITLTPLSVDLSAVEIAAKRKELFAIKQLKDVEGTAIFAGKKSEVVVLDLIKGNLASNNSRQVYAQVAGLNIYEGSDGGLQLNIGGRGLDPNRTSNFNTRQNNYDISADVLGYPENYYTPPSEAVSEIQIVRGASSLQYGTQFGGLINFKLRSIPRFKKLEVRSRQTFGSYGFFNTFNSVGITKGKWQFNAFYNYKQGNGFRPNSTFNAHNGYASLSYHLSERTSMKLEFTLYNYLAKQAGGLTDEQFLLDPRMSTRSRNWFAVDWKLYEWRLDHKFAREGKLSLSVFALDAERKSVGFRGNPINLNENPITALDEQDSNGQFILPRDLILGQFRNHGAELRYLKKFTAPKTSIFLVGAKYYNALNNSIQGPGSNGIDADFNIATTAFPDYANQSEFEFPNLNFSLFSEFVYYFNEKISVVPGMRLESINTGSSGTYNQVIFDNANNPIANRRLEEERNFDRRIALFGLGFNYKDSDRFNLFANFSQNYRSVTFSDIRIVSPSFIVDPDISDERGFTGDLGFNAKWKNKISYGLGIYSLWYGDRIGVILDDRANRVRKNIGSALIAGIESIVDVNFVKLIKEEQSKFTLNGYSNIAYTYSNYVRSEENNVVGKRVEFIPIWNVKSGLNFGYQNWLGAIQYTHLSEQFTDVQNSSIADPTDIRHGIIGEIPAYSVWDASISYGLREWSFEIGCNNFLNRNYYTRRATGYPGPGIIPSMGRSFYVTFGYTL